MPISNFYANIKPQPRLINQERYSPMQQQTDLAQIIDLIDIRAKYDECAKKLLTFQSIIAWILKSCTKEFSQYSTSYICENCLKEKPQFLMQAIHQDQPDKETPLDGDTRIDTLNSESTSIKEQTVYYDVRFRAFLPKETKPIQLIINLEVQLDDTPGYPLIKRGIYYCSRMISEQYGTVFTKEEYEKIQKVYSIWIFPDPAKKRANGIFRYRMTEEPIYGKPYEKLENYDLTEVVIVNLGDAKEESGVEILNLLNTLFSSTLTSTERKKRLANDFNIAMTVELEEEVERMSSLSQVLVNQGEERGIKLGEERGIKLGEERGIKLGEERGIKLGEERGIKLGEERGTAKGIIEMGQKFNIPIVNILEQLQESLHISPEQAKAYLDKFSK